MRTVPDAELQATLSIIREVNEKKRKLEENLRAADVRNKLLLESAARKDIEAYKNRHVVATPPTSQ
jgi:hypothetical protein